MDKNSQRVAFEAFVRSGASPVPPSEIGRPLADGSYRTSAANAGWAFWQAAQAPLQRLEVHADAPDLGRCKELLSQKFVMFAPPRTGMSLGPILPEVLWLANRNANVPEKDHEQRN